MSFSGLSSLQQADIAAQQARRGTNEPGWQALHSQYLREMERERDHYRGGFDFQRAFETVLNELHNLNKRLKKIEQYHNINIEEESI